MSRRDLERIVETGPSRGAWDQVVRALGDPALVLSPGELDALDRALAGWPAEIREAPAAWPAARDGEPPPWWRLVRRVKLMRGDEPDEPVLAALAHVTSLALDPMGVSWVSDGLERLPQLEQLELFALEDFASFTALPVLPALHTVLARGCPHLDDLTGLDAQPALRVLDLSSSYAGLDLATLPALPALRVLGLQDTEIDDLAPLASLTGLERLQLGRCRRVTDLAPLASCARLAWLDVSQVPAIRSAAPLAALAQLGTLWIDGEVIGRLDSLVGLPIEQLIAGRAAAVDTASIARLAALDNLHLVDIAHAPLAALASSPVKQLFVLRCEHTGDPAAFAGLARVQVLVLDDLAELRDLAAVGAMPALTELHVTRCRALTDISGLAAARGLEMLVLRSCPGVTDGSVLASLPALRRLDLTDTPVSGIDTIGSRVTRA